MVGKERRENTEKSLPKPVEGDFVHLLRLHH